MDQLPERFCEMHVTKEMLKVLHNRLTEDTLDETFKQELATVLKSAKIPSKISNMFGDYRIVLPDPSIVDNYIFYKHLRKFISQIPNWSSSIFLSNTLTYGDVERIHYIIKINTITNEILSLRKNGSLKPKQSDKEHVLFYKFEHGLRADKYAVLKNNHWCTISKEDKEHLERIENHISKYIYRRRASDITTEEYKVHH